MAKEAIKTGTTSYMCGVIINDSASTSGGFKTGLIPGDFDLAYKRFGTGVTDDSGNLTINTISDLGTFAGSSTAAAIKEVDATTCPGLYELHLPNNAFATGATSVAFVLKDSDGTNDIAPLGLEFQLVAYDPNSYIAVGASGDVTVGTMLTNSLVANAINDGAFTAAKFATDTKLRIRKATAITGFPFVMFSDTTGQLAAGLTCSVQVSKNGGAFANIANTGSIAGVGSGLYKCDLSGSSGDTDADFIVLKFTATGARDSALFITTNP